MWTCHSCLWYCCQWREASYVTSSQSSSSAANWSSGQVLRVYTVCNVVTSPVHRLPVVHHHQQQQQQQQQRQSRRIDNWLRSPFIQVADAQRVYVDISFTMRRCAVYDQHGHQSSAITTHNCTYSLCTSRCTYCIRLAHSQLESTLPCSVNSDGLSPETRRR